MKHIALLIAASAIIFSGCGLDSGEKTGAEQVANMNHPDEPYIEDPVLRDAEISNNGEEIERDVFEDSAEIEAEIGERPGSGDCPFNGPYGGAAIGIGGRSGGSFRRHNSKETNEPADPIRKVKDAKEGTLIDRAIRLGLRWLADHQNPDGMWSCRLFASNCKKGRCDGKGAGSQYDVGVTGLSLFAFLRAHDSMRDSEYKDTVVKGLKALIQRQTSEGRFGCETADGTWIYNHAICTLAMIEAYGFWAPLEIPANNAIVFLVDCGNPEGGWGYGKMAGDSNGSVTGWAVLALKSADPRRYLPVPAKSIQGAGAWFDQVTDGGTFRTRYSLSGDTSNRPEGFVHNEGMTAVALLSKLLILGEKEKESPLIEGMARRIQEDLPAWNTDMGTIDLSFWHFATMAMFRMGSPFREDWGEALKKALLPNQRLDGCAKGSWDPAGAWGGTGGRVYSTAINVMTLSSFCGCDLVRGNR